MKSRPILFSGPMVRALLAGTKTQTRRICKPQPIDVVGSRRRRMYRDEDFKKSWQTIPGCLEGDGFVDCPHGQPGDRMWVRENFAFAGLFDTWKPSQFDSVWSKHQKDEGLLWYSADGDQPAGPTIGERMNGRGRWRPSIHMPRWVSRITQEITGVRSERLQKISPSDAAAEGLSFGSSRMDQWHVDGKCSSGDSVHCYAKLWESINGPGSWAANPWVWVIEFKRVTP